MNRSIFETKMVTPILLSWLVVSIAFLSCSKKDLVIPIDKTALKLSVNTAKMLIQNTVEGIKPGEYAIGSKNALLTVLNTSEDILNDGTATQEKVNNATALLDDAIAVYRGQYSPQISPKPKPVLTPTWIIPK